MQIKATVDVASLDDYIIFLSQLSDGTVFNLTTIQQIKQLLGTVNDATDEIETTGEEDLTLSNNYISGSIRLYKKGVGMDVAVRLASTDFDEIDDNTIRLRFVPNNGDIFIVDYKY